MIDAPINGASGRRVNATGAIALSALEKALAAMGVRPPGHNMLRGAKHTITRMMDPRDTWGDATVLAARATTSRDRSLARHATPHLDALAPDPNRCCARPVACAIFTLGALLQI